MLESIIKRQRRHKRVRAKISGTAKKPRLCVFRSAKYIYAQLIDDQKNKTLATADDRKMSSGKAAKNAGKESKNLKNKESKAFKVGQAIAVKALEKKINEVVFDRGGYKYHGRVKSLADGAREGGLKF